MKKKSLSQLLQTPPAAPPEYEPLRKLRKDNVAKYLGVTPAYFYNILSGSKKPGKSLHQKIMILISDLHNEAMEAN